MDFDAAEMLAGLFDAPVVRAALARVPERAAVALGTVLETTGLLDAAPETGPGPYADWVQAADTRGRSGWQRPDAPVPFPAWEDLLAWSGNAPAAPGGGPCWWCGRRQWWRSIHGAVVCGYCHPPAAPGLIADWLNVAKKD